MLKVRYKKLIKKIVFLKRWYFVNISVFPLYFGSFLLLFKNVLKIIVSLHTRSPETMFKVKVEAFFSLQKVIIKS